MTRLTRMSALGGLAVLLVAGPAQAMSRQLSSGSSQPTAHAVITHVGPTQWALIVSTGTWHKGCPGGRLTFRRVVVNFHGFDGAVHRGVLIVNRDVASSVARTMTRLFNENFPIHRMHPIEYYDGDDNRSMRADNTSAMNCRNDAQANAPAKDSPHANGRAVDINPWENPWVDPRCGCFRPDKKFGTTRHGQGVITAKGVVVRAFRSAKWVWRGTGKAPDYQHFDTGYPSRPPPH